MLPSPAVPDLQSLRSCRPNPRVGDCTWSCMGQVKFKKTTLIDDTGILTLANMKQHESHIFCVERNRTLNKMVSGTAPPSTLGTQF